jgi:GTP cyclohydrolase IA
MSSDAEAKKALETILSWIGEDIKRPGLHNTPNKVIEGYRDLFSGYQKNPDSIIDDSSFNKGVDGEQIIVLKGIRFNSFCEHHFLPFSGSIDIAYLPTNGVVGFGRILRVIEVFTKRLQLQERMTQEIAEALSINLRSEGVVVFVKAKHSCLNMLSKEADPEVCTEKILGEFRNNDMLMGRFHNIKNERMKDEV